eukprot:15920345-Heterocapsa_arctica.AAC.1
MPPLSRSSSPAVAKKNKEEVEEAKLMKLLQGMTPLQILSMASLVTTNRQGGALQWRVMLKTVAFIAEPAIAS